MARDTLVVDKIFPVNFAIQNDLLRSFAILGITEAHVYLDLNVVYEEDDVVELDGFKDDITGHITFFKDDDVFFTMVEFDKQVSIAKCDILKLFEINLDKLLKEQGDD